MTTFPFDAPAQNESAELDFWALFTQAAGATVADAAMYRAIAEAIRRIGGLAGLRVAEIGSGSGRCAATIAKFSPQNLLAVEKSADLTAMSRKLYPEVEVVNDDFANLAKFGSFDVVFAVAHLLFIHETIDEFIAALRNVRAAMPDYGILVLEQFELTDLPRDYGSLELRVHEDTVVADRQRLQHTFTVTVDADVVASRVMTSLVLDRADLDAAVREASFLIGAEWEQQTPTGELSRFYLLRAQKGFNYLSDLPEFLESWLHQGHPRNDTPRSISIDENGRARPQGTLAWGQGASLSRHHAEFLDSIEPAIRPLVVELVTGWNFVTYSSCEGHVHSQTPPVHYSESYCGLVAFDDKHVTALQSLLRMCSQDWMSEAVQPRVRTRPLLGPTSEQSAVDLLITRTTPDISWPLYQQERDRLIAHLCKRLEALRRDTDA